MNSDERRKEKEHRRARGLQSLLQTKPAPPLVRKENMLSMERAGALTHEANCRTCAAVVTPRPTVELAPPLTHEANRVTCAAVDTRDQS
jgi:hypothetical protein